MTRQASLFVAAGGVCLIAVTVLAQPDTESPPPGPFAVASGSESAVLLDASTGRTWLLVTPGGQEESVWLPIRRIDDREEVERWKAEARQRQEILAEQERKARQLQFLQRAEQALPPDHPQILKLRKELGVETTDDKAPQQ